MKATFTNEHGETMFLEETRKGYFYFSHEDCNDLGEGIEVRINDCFSGAIPFSLTNSERAFIETFKLVLTAKYYRELKSL